MLGECCKFSPVVFSELARHSHSQKSGYWADRGNRRTFLLAFAEKVGFDPMIKSNWQGRTAKLHANQVRVTHFIHFSKLSHIS